MKVAVVALGKIGLPLAVQVARSGHNVVGIDVDEARVDSVNAGHEPFPGEEHLAEYLAEAVASESLSATTDFAVGIPDADAVIIVVPLLFDDVGDTPDFRAMDQAVRATAQNLTPNTLVLFETTLPVGTTRNRWKPMVESISGLSEEDGIHLVFSPERVLTGRVFSDLRRYPKLVGGLSEAGAALAHDFYNSVLTFDERPDLDRPNGVWNLGSAEAAEMSKLAETTYRDVNIALANQFATHAQAIGVDVFAVIAAANSQPYSHIHRPGISVGGHCIPVYPKLYLSGDPEASVVRVARAANERMPGHAIDLLLSALDGDLRGRRIAVFGAAYRAGAKETAVSGVFPLVELLHDSGAIPFVHDPLYSDDELRSLGFTPYHVGDQVEAAIIHTDHEEYGRLSEADVPGATVLVDGRAITEPSMWPSLTRLVIGDGTINRDRRGSGDHAV